MAGSLNKIMIIGNVGRAPEVRYTPNGSPVASFSVATNRKWNTPSGELKEETEWFNVIAWNRLAEICNQYVEKGKKIYVEGRVHVNNWEAPDGRKGTRVEIVAFDIQLLDTRPKTAAAAPEETYSEDDIGAEEIPF